MGVGKKNKTKPNGASIQNFKCTCLVNWWFVMWHRHYSQELLDWMKAQIWSAHSRHNFWDYFCWEQNVLNYVNKLKVLLFMRSQQLFLCRYNVWWTHLFFKEISYSTAVPTFHPLSGPAMCYSTSARSFHSKYLSIHFSDACHSLLTILFLKIGFKRNNTT